MIEQDKLNEILSNTNCVEIKTDFINYIRNHMSYTIHTGLNITDIDEQIRDVENDIEHYNNNLDCLNNAIDHLDSAINEINYYDNDDYDCDVAPDTYDIDCLIDSMRDNATDIETEIETLQEKLNKLETEKTDVVSYDPFNDMQSVHLIGNIATNDFDFNNLITIYVFDIDTYFLILQNGDVFIDDTENTDSTEHQETTTIKINITDNWYNV